jgi:hypothetical protein
LLAVKTCSVHKGFSKAWSDLHTTECNDMRHVVPWVFKFDFIEQPMAATELTGIACGHQVILSASPTALKRHHVINRSCEYRKPKVALFVRGTPRGHGWQCFGKRLSRLLHDHSRPAEATAITIPNEDLLGYYYGGHSRTFSLLGAREYRGLCLSMNRWVYRPGELISIFLQGAEIRFSKQVCSRSQIALQQGAGSRREQVCGEIALR